MNSLRKVLVNSRIIAIRRYSGLGSGVGKGGGGGGSIREAGGGLGKSGAAKEEEYFHRKKMEQLAKLKAGLAPNKNQGPMGQKQGDNKRKQ